MAGAVMTATSDYNMCGGMSHNQCQYNSAGMNSSRGVMPTNSQQACHEKARNSVAQSANARKSMIESFSFEMGSSSSSNVEAVQLELADVLRGILEEQEAELANHNTNYNLSDYSLSSLIKATTSSVNPQGNQSVISVNNGHDADPCGLLINPDVLDVGTLHHATSEYDIAAIGAESLLVIPNPFNLDGADDHQSLAPASAQRDYSRLTCINSTSCSNNDYLLCKSSSSNILQGYSDDHLHQQLEPVEMDTSCRVKAHDSFDDYSLSTINGGSAVVGCNEVLASKLGPSSLEILNSSADEPVEIIDDDDDDDDNHCDQHKTVIAADMTSDHGHGENVCIQEGPHVIAHQLDSNIEGDITNCVKDSAAGIAACAPEYGMVSICNEGALYPSGGQMKLMQREAAYAAAAMQPVDWAGVMAMSAGARPKRRNVRISQDPQTVSARRRRERISDRIRVLQRMVPGGTKLDTASMLDEAIHYLKYLKSQVQALEWLERSSSPSAASNLSLASSQPPYCLYPNFSTNYIQHCPSSRLMIIK